MPLIAIGAALGIGSASAGTAMAILAGVGGAAAVGVAGMGIASLVNSGRAMKSSNNSDVGAQDIGNLTTDEAQAAATKRMARIGKYFTSPVGDLSALNSGTTKVFS
jgi:hypothetical protein